MSENSAALLRRFALRDTQSRRLVLEAFQHFKKPIAQKEIYNWIKKKGAATNLVTVYRTLETFEEKHIIHRHPSTGGYVLCSQNEEEGHHGFLSCESCGRVEEFHSKSFSSNEHRIAKEAGFEPKKHVSEIIGVCATCK